MKLIMTLKTIWIIIVRWKGSWLKLRREGFSIVIKLNIFPSGANLFQFRLSPSGCDKNCFNTSLTLSKCHSNPFTRSSSHLEYSQRVVNIHILIAKLWFSFVWLFEDHLSFYQVLTCGWRRNLRIYSQSLSTTFQFNVLFFAFFSFVGIFPKGGN